MTLWLFTTLDLIGSVLLELLPFEFEITDEQTFVNNYWPNTDELNWSKCNLERNYVEDIKEVGTNNPLKTNII